jgi:hypothetical protein
MDLNYLYQRHQVSVMLARAAASKSARSSHAGLARAYAARIEAERDLRAADGVSGSEPTGRPPAVWNNAIENEA